MIHRDAAAPDIRGERHQDRIPLFTPVLASGIGRCWGTNISAGGIGLSAFLSDDDEPERGDEIDVEFVLGVSKRRVRATGRIAWRSRRHAGGSVALGVEFLRLSPVDRAALARFLAGHRPRVLVASTHSEDRELAAAALADLDVEHIDGVIDLSEEMVRSCAAIIIFCDEEERLAHLLDRFRGQPADGILPGASPAAPITLCTTIGSDQLLPLFNEGRIYEVLRPPFDRGSLALAARRSCERRALQVELNWASLQLEASLQQPTVRSPGPAAGDESSMVRASAPMRRAYELIQTVAVHDVPVLLLGETGTGKELAARKLHGLSRRANTPFLTQDCGALTETLLESELFGHVKGAFTGASTDHPGLFQIADGGTIFLDEIQNTTPALQAKLLRVVEEGEVRPVGSPQVRPVDVRFIAASNVDLRRAVKEHRFRADFFYRLNRFPIELPPLRERRDDIVPLAKFFVASLSEGLARPPCRLDDELERRLVSYDWPGNVRELKNAIERAILLTPPGERLRSEALTDDVRGSTGSRRGDRSLRARVESFERHLIEEALERAGGVVRRAADELQVNPVTLGRKIRRLGI